MKFVPRRLTIDHRTNGMRFDVGTRALFKSTSTLHRTETLTATDGEEKNKSLAASSWIPVLRV